MGNAFFRNDGEGFKRVRNIRHRGDAGLVRDRVAKGLYKEFGADFDGVDDYGSIPMADSFGGQDWLAIEIEAMLAGDSPSGYVLSRGYDDWGVGYGWNHLIRIGDGWVSGSFATNIPTTGAQTLGYAIETVERWVKIKDEYIYSERPTHNLYVNDSLVATKGDYLSNWIIRPAKHLSCIGRLPRLGDPQFFKGQLRNAKYYRNGILTNHYPLDDDPKTGVFRDVVGGVTATKYGNPTIPTKRLNL